MFNLQKGITPIISAILMILIIVSLSMAFFQWNKYVNEIFENTTKDRTESEMEMDRTSFMIVNVAGNQVGIKNNGRVYIGINHFSFYLNETKYDSILDEPLGETSMDPADIFIFNITGFVDGDYVIKVTGPYGIADEVFDELTN